MCVYKYIYHLPVYYSLYISLVNKNRETYALPIVIKYVKEKERDLDFLPEDTSAATTAAATTTATTATTTITTTTTTTITTTATAVATSSASHAAFTITATAAAMTIIIAIIMVLIVIVIIIIRIVYISITVSTSLSSRHCSKLPSSFFARPAAVSFLYTTRMAASVTSTVLKGPYLQRAYLIHYFVSWILCGFNCQRYKQCQRVVIRYTNYASLQ